MFETTNQVLLTCIFGVPSGNLACWKIPEKHGGLDKRENNL